MKVKRQVNAKYQKAIKNKGWDRLIGLKMVLKKEERVVLNC